MINKLSREIGRSLSLSNVEVECVSLGISIIVFQLLGFIVATIIGMLFNVVLELFLVIVLYIPLRVCAGGFHAKNPEFCMMYSSIMLCLMCIGIKYVSWDYGSVPHLIFILLFLIARSIVDSKSMIYRKLKLGYVAQTKYAVSIINLMCIVYAVSYVFSYYSLMQYIIIGLLANVGLILVGTVLNESV